VLLCDPYEATCDFALSPDRVEETTEKESVNLSGRPKDYEISTVSNRKTLGNHARRSRITCSHHDNVTGGQSGFLQSPVKIFVDEFEIGIVKPIRRDIL
jgi:hypothetical protein